MEKPRQEPCFSISVVARMVRMHPQTIRHYERLGLIRPSRTSGNTRLFSQSDVELLERIQSFTELGVNLAGVEVIVNLLERMDRMRAEAEERMLRMEREMEHLRMGMEAEDATWEL